MQPPSTKNSQWANSITQDNREKSPRKNSKPSRKKVQVDYSKHLKKALRQNSLQKGQSSSKKNLIIRQPPISSSMSKGQPPLGMNTHTDRMGTEYSMMSPTHS